MPSRKRIVVLGTHNSGSSAVAGILHHLGINMGPPFWETSDENSEKNHYEPLGLTQVITKWWDEPRIVERVSRQFRFEYFQSWAESREAISPDSSIGIKHPLLAFCCKELLEAWGTETRFIWSWRPKVESVDGLKRRGWFKGFEESLIQKEWDALNRFASSHKQVHRLNWHEVLSDRSLAISELVSQLEIEPSKGQLTKAVEFIRIKTGK